MSRDFTPKEIDCIQKSTNMPNIVESMQVQIGDKQMSLYSEEQKELVHQYPNLGKFGFDMLNVCRNIGILKDEKGKELLKKIDDYFNGQDIDNKELEKAVQSWYEGTFCPGYYMNDNDSEFAYYLKSLISMKIVNI